MKISNVCRFLRYLYLSVMKKIISSNASNMWTLYMTIIIIAQGIRNQLRRLQGLKSLSEDKLFDVHYRGKMDY